MSSLLTSSKGTSTVVAVVAVMTMSILLAIGLGYAFTNAIRVSLAPVSCAPLQITPPLVIEKAVYKAAEGRVEITLKRQLEAATLSSFSAQVTDAAGRLQTWECTSTCGGCTIMGAGETKTYSFNENIGSSYLSLEVDGCLIASRELEQA